MTASVLRLYQVAAVREVNSKIGVGWRGPLVVDPTASGETIIFTALIAQAVRTERRVVVVAHRRELMAEMVAKLATAGIDAAFIKAGFKSPLKLPVQVTSIQTLYVGANRGSAVEMPSADRVVIDAAHRARADTYLATFDVYLSAITLGFTATPCRQDGPGPGEIFDALIECPKVAELTAMGWLGLDGVYVPSVPNVTGVRVEHGRATDRRSLERNTLSSAVQ